MPVITLEKAKKYEYAIGRFLKAIGHKEKILQVNTKLIEAAYRYFLPFVNAYMKYTINEINKAFSKKYIKKSVGFQKDRAINITTNLLDWGKLNNTGVKMLKPATLEVIARSGDVANKIAGIEGAFDIVNPEVVAAVNKIALNAVVEVGKETKLAINEIIRQGLIDGKSMGKIAKELRPLVGLTSRQAIAVEKYRKWLDLKRPELTALKRQKWVEKYRNKLHKYRTNLISRTESMRSVSEGSRISYKNAGYTILRWEANVDACPDCDARSGHEYTVEEAEGLIPLHPACRCVWVTESKTRRLPEIPKLNPSYLDMPAPYSEKVVDRYIRDIKSHKKVVPVFVDKENYRHIVDGLHRATAYDRLGMKVPILPVNRVDTLTALAKPGMTPEKYFNQIRQLQVVPKVPTGRIKQLNEIGKFNKKYANAKAEHSIVVDKNGNILLNKTGSKNQINYTSKEMKKIINRDDFLISIHNHPSGNSFSCADIDFLGAINNKNMMVETRVIANEYKYSTKITDFSKFPGDRIAIKKAYDGINLKIYEKYKTLFQKEHAKIMAMPPEKVNYGKLIKEMTRRIGIAHTDETITSFSKKYGLEYKRWLNE